MCSPEMVTQIALTALGAFLGAALSLLITVAIEHQKKPKLRLTIESPPLVRSNPAGAPANDSTFLRMVVTNRRTSWPLRWLVRSAAYQCTGNIQFHYLGDGALLFQRAMPIRWANSDEPFTPQLQLGQVVEIFDPVKYNAAFRRDCFPQTPELVDVVARHDQDQDCYGWCNESYIKGWRNPDFCLPPGRYLVRVTIMFSGDTTSEIFKLENSLTRSDFRLLPATDEDKDKLK